MKKSNKTRNKAVATVVTTAMLISMTPTTIYADELPEGGVRVSNEQSKAYTFTKKSNTDIIVDVGLSGKTIKEIKNTTANDAVLNQETDYTVSGSEITVKGSYLDTLAANNYTLTVSYTEDDTTTPIEITVEKATRNLSISNLNEISKTYDGQEITAPTIDLQEVSATIEYKLQSQDDSEYTEPAPKAAGLYNVRVTVPGDADYKDATVTENFEISAKEVSLTWTSLEFDADEAEHVPTATIIDAENAIVSGDTCTVKVSGGTAVAGKHTATATLEGESASNYTIKEEDKTKEFTIRAAQEAPVGLEGVAETVFGKNDGKITGLTTDMEYRKKSDDNEEQYSPVTSSDMTFAVGTYEVRYKATDGKKASDAAEVTIAAGNKLTVTGPEEHVGYTLDIESPEVAYDGSTKVTINFETEYNKTATFKVKVNDKDVTVSGDNTFTIEDIQEAKVITVEGVKDTVAPTGEITIAHNTWKELLNTITFGKFFKNTKDVTISSDDKGSGVKAVYYYISNEQKSLEDIEALADEYWTKKEDTLSINPEDGKVIVYAKVVDNADNKTYISSDGMVMYKDATAENTEISYSKGSEKDATAKINLNGNTIKEIKNGDATLTKDTDYEVSEDGTITFKNSYLENCTIGDNTITVSYNPLGETFVEAEGNEAPAETTITLKVKKADATITIGDIAEKEYDGKAITAPTYNANSSGKVTVEYKAIDAEDGEYTKDAPKNVGEYTVKVTVAEDDNYAETSATKDFTISKKAVNATVTAENKDYDGKVGATLNATVETGVEGESLTIIDLTGTFADKNAGADKAVTVNKDAAKVQAGANTNVDNYEITIPESTTATINKKAVIAEISAENKPYDGTTDVTLTITVITGIEGEVLAATGVTGSFADKNVGENKVVNIEKAESGIVEAGANTNVDNYEVIIPTDNVKASIGAKEVTIAWSSAEFTYNEKAQVPEATSEDILKDDDCTIKVTANKEAINAGDYTATATLEGEGATNYNLIGENLTKEYTIKNASQEAPEVTGVAETISGKADGTITGLTTDMEYSTKSDDTDAKYEKVTDPKMTFAAGTYYIRNAAKENYDASKPTTVTIEAGEKLNVILPAKDEQVGYTLTVDNSEVDWQGSAKITFELKEGYNKNASFAIKVNGEKVNLTNNEITSVSNNGLYTITNIKKDQTITVEGVEDKTAPTGSIKISDNTWSSLLNSITFSKFFKETQDVKITAEDLGSGMDKVYYYLSDKAISEEGVPKISDSDWKEYRDSLEISEENNYVVYAKLVDKAGNVTYISSDGVVIDTTAAVVDGVETNGVYVGTKTFKVTEKNLESVEVNGKVVTPVDEDGNYELRASSEPYIIIVTDKAGNVTTVENVTVNKADATIKIGDIAEKEYDGEAIKTPTYETDSTGAVTIEYKDKSVENSEYTIDAPKDAGEYTVKVTVAEDENYAKTSVTKDFTISKKSVTAQVIAEDKEYDGTKEVAVQATVQTGIDGEELTIFEVTGAFKDANVGENKTVIVNSDSAIVEGKEGTNPNNYKVTFHSSTIAEIQAKEIGIKWVGAELTYNGQEQGPMAIATGVLEQDICELVFDGKGNDAGIYTAKVTAIDNDNYKLPKEVTKEFEIAPKKVEATIEVEDKEYDGTKEAAVQATVQTGIDGEELTISEVTAAFKDANAGENKNVIINSNSAIIEGKKGTNTNNYKVIFPSSTTAEIEAKEIGIEWVGTELTYNGQEQCPLAIATGVLEQDICELLISGKGKDVGDYTSKVIGLDNENYKLPKEVTKNFKIVAKEVAIKWIDANLTYNGEEQGLEAKAIGLIGKDICQVTVEGKGKDAGNYTAKVIALGNKNYKLPETGLTKDFEIGAKEIGIEWADSELTYNGKEQAPQAKATGLVGEDSCNVTVEGAINAGTHEAIAIGVDNKNYKLPEIMSTKSFEIAAKEVNIIWSNTELTYNGQGQVPEANSEDILEGDDCSIKVYSNAEVPINAGKYEALAELHGDDKDNYTIKNPIEEYTIKNASQDAPKVDVGQDETISGKEDGTIAGLTTDMEYRKKSDDAKYEKVTDPNMTFAAGTYEVRMAAKENYDESEPTEVTIGKGKMLNVSVAGKQDGYTLEIQHNEVSWNGETKVTFNLADGYSLLSNFEIAVNGKVVELAQDNTFTISHIQENQVITVEGVADTTEPTGNIEISKTLWDSFLDVIDFNDYFNTDLQVKITADDIGSGVDKVYYYVSNEVMNKDKIKGLSEEDWKEYSKPFSISEDNNYVVYAKITDKAGNTIYISSDGVVIDKVPASITGIESGKTYTGTTTFTVTDNNLKFVEVNGEKVDADNYKLVPSETPYTIVATDKAGNVTTIENVTVNKVQATITNISDVSKEYDGKDIEVPTFETNSDVEATIEYKAEGSEEYTTELPKDAGKYTVRISIDANGEYTEVSETKNFEIAAKEIGIEWIDANLTYNGQEQGLEAKATGLVGEDICDLVVEGKGIDAGDYTAEVKEISNKNYKLPKEVTKAFTIAAKEVGIEWIDAKLTYNGQEQGIEAEATGLVGEDTCKVTVEGKGKNAGSYTAKATALDNDNYKLPEEVVTKDFEIAAKEVGIEWVEAELTYNGQEQGIEAKATELVDGDTCKVTVEGKGKDAGSYTAKVTAIDNDNYKLPEEVLTKDFEIAAKEVTITWSDTEFNYDGEDHTPKATADGILEDDTCEVVVEGSDKTVGTHKATAKLEGEDAANYNLVGENLSTEYVIKNASQEAPEVIGEAETISGKGDGTITGLTTDMEYRKKSDDAKYEKVTDPNMTFAAGTYEVRMAAKENYDESKATEVTITEGRKLTVSVEGNQDGYELTIENKEVSWNDSTNITFNLSTGYLIPKELVVKVNGKVVEIVKDKDTVTISNIQEDQVITVEGVADITEPTGKIEISENSWSSLLDTITFGKFFNKNLDVNITAEDAGSGVNKICYYVSNEAMDADTVKALSDEDWKEYTDTFSISEDNQYVVYAKITDKAGNTIYISSDGVVLDKVPATVSGVESGKTYTGTTTVKVSDDNLESVEINGKLIEKAESYELVPSETPYTIVATDKAGNVTTIDNVTVNWYEVEAPTVDSKVYTGENLVADIKDSDQYKITDNKGGVNVGSYDVVLTLADTVNYKWKTEEAGKATTTVKFEITKATPDVAAPIAKELTYNGSMQELVVNATTNAGTVLYKLAGGEWSKDIPTAKNAGEYTVYYKVEGDDNFNSTEENSVTVSIAKKDAKIEVLDKEKTYGENDAELTYQVSGLVENDELTDVTLTRKAGENVGKYEITANVAEESNPNYNVSVESGVYTINPKAVVDSKVVVELKDALKYTEKEQAQEVSKVFIDGEEISSDDYIIENNVGTEPGVYTMNITMKDTSNYVGGFEYKFVIAPTEANKVEEDKDGNIKIGDGALEVTVKSDEKAPETTLVTDKSEIIDMLIDGGSLSADELVEIANGAKLDVVLTVEDASETVSEESKKQIEAKTDGYTVVQYLNISLAKYMVVDGEVKAGENVVETANKIKVSIKIPDELLADGVNRQFYIVRNHNGEVELIEGVYDEATHTFTFETDKFSDYALAYKDAADNKNDGNKDNNASQDKTKGDDKKKDSKTAKTGDTSRSLPYSVAMIVGAVGAFIFKKKRH